MFGPQEDMQNHPGQQEKPPGAKEAFNFFAALILLACRIVGVFWAMISKKFGTVGTRVYAFDFMCAIPMFLALRQNDWYPDKYAFELMGIITAAGFLMHLSVTIKQKHHVHTKCMGDVRGGALTEFALWGTIVGACLVFNMGPTAVFVTVSLLGHHVFMSMVSERDRQRSVMMADAMMEQEYMMNAFESYRRGKA